MTARQSRRVWCGSLAAAVVMAAAVGAAQDGYDMTQPRFTTPLPGPLAARPDDPAEPERQGTFEDQVMELVNQQRWDYASGHLPPLKRQALLDTSAEGHSSRMATYNFFAHCDPDTGTMPWDRMTAAGYNWNSAGENIAAGQSTPAAVMTAWMNSTGHRENILSTSNRELGIGYVYDGADYGNVRGDANGDCTPDTFNLGPYFHYWTQNFGRRNTVYPVVIDREAYETADVNVDLYLYGTGWATQMRIRNDTGTWTAWQPFAADVAWQLPTGPGIREVFVEITNGSTTYAASDTIVSAASGDDMIFGDGFNFGSTSAWSATEP